MTTTLDTLQSTQRLLEDLQRSIETQVVELRAHGASWGAIGAALGISRQAAQQRFGGRRRDIEDLPLSDPLFDPLFSAKQE